MEVDVRNITYHAIAMSVLPCVASAFADPLGFVILCLWQAAVMALAWSGIRGLIPTSSFERQERTYLAVAFASNVAAGVVLLTHFI